ncbi:MAG TPA: DUF559 domain-containing protein [Thermoleophilaceae bacterium]|nr:DUF559 domain-containing protein [Thermoleophilaceae bacterium]
MGFEAGAIRHRVATARLHVVHPRVYAVGRRELSPRGRWLAAVKAVGEGAVLSHRSAAALHGLAPEGAGLPHVTAPRRGTRPARRGIHVHRPRSLAADEVGEADGIPATSVSRTLLDLAETESRRLLGRALEQAERLRVFDRGEIEAVIARGFGRRGLAPLRAALAVFDGDPGTRSELESRFLGLCRASGLPAPMVNCVVAGLEVDFAWPKLVVELDGYEFHGGREAFERDRERDAVLQAAGLKVLRLTARRLDRDAAGAMAAVAALMR